MKGAESPSTNNGTKYNEYSNHGLDYSNSSVESSVDKGTNEAEGVEPGTSSADATKEKSLSAQHTRLTGGVPGQHRKLRKLITEFKDYMCNPYCMDHPDAVFSLNETCPKCDTSDSDSEKGIEDTDVMLTLERQASGHDKKHKSRFELLHKYLDVSLYEDSVEGKHIPLLEFKRDEFSK